MRSKVVGLFACLAGANLLAWVWALLAFRGHPLLLGTAFLAYALGLRHAVDADHLAAIDNVTRKLMQQGRRPLAVGLFFSLGHSTVVIAASAALALSSSAIEARFAPLRPIGGLIGTGVSALFLLGIAAANAIVLAQLWRVSRRLRRGGGLIEEDLDALQAKGGFLNRLCRPVFRLIGRSWHMYPLGLLFGLGFDTATEIALLGLSATEASKGLPIWSIIVFPALFAAGMSLADTLDGVLMLGAYGWAFANPLRKIHYNLTVTFASVLVAVVIGSIEMLGLAADELYLTGPFWSAVRRLNDNFATLGCLVIALFAAGWLASLAIDRARRQRGFRIPSSAPPLSRADRAPSRPDRHAR